MSIRQKICDSMSKGYFVLLFSFSLSLFVELVGFENMRRFLCKSDCSWCSCFTNSWLIEKLVKIEGKVQAYFHCFNQTIFKSWMWWHMPLVLALQEIGAEGSKVGAQPRQLSHLVWYCLKSKIKKDCRSSPEWRSWVQFPVLGGKKSYIQVNQLVGNRKFSLLKSYSWERNGVSKCNHFQSLLNVQIRTMTMCYGLDQKCLRRV